jgi:cell division protein FtsB
VFGEGSLVASAARYSGRLRARGIRWDRISRVALLAVLGIILLLYLSPAKHWIEQSRTAGAQHKELQRLQAEHQRLERRARALRDPAAVERQARRLGMVRRGERAYVIEGLPAR